jgi:putative membrane protein
MKNFLLFLNLLILAGLAYVFSGAENMKDEQPSTPEASPSADIVIVKEATFEKKTPAPVRTPPQAQEVNMGDLLADLDDAPIDQVVETFLTKTAESRIMDFEEGKTAQQKSTVDAIKDYGSLMVQDQSKMLADLHALAAFKHIALPDTPDDQQQKALADLQQEEGKSFDRKFIKMMIIDHKRDVKKFRKAAQSHDPDVRAFALKYLPVVESHLDDVQKLKK